MQANSAEKPSQEPHSVTFRVLGAKRYRDQFGQEAAFLRLGLTDDDKRGVTGVELPIYNTGSSALSPGEQLLGQFERNSNGREVPTLTLLLDRDPAVVEQNHAWSLVRYSLPPEPSKSTSESISAAG